MDKITAILQYWFQGISDQTPDIKNHPSAKRWFMKSPFLDEEIRQRFEPDLLNAQSGLYKNWESSPQGQLALVILLDQFARNIYRNTPKMFDFDSSALKITLKMIDEKLDQSLQLIERVFLYMPLQHAEDLSLQKKSLECFKDMVNVSNVKSRQNTAYYVYTLGYAQKHYDIIARFGRFPHRNEVLNRVSIQEEVEFLKGPGSKF